MGNILCFPISSTLDSTKNNNLHLFDDNLRNKQSLLLAFQLNLLTKFKKREL